MTMQRDPDQLARSGHDRRRPHAKRGAPQRSASGRTRRLPTELRRKTYIARGGWLGAAWTATLVEGSSVELDDVRANSLAGLPDAIRRRLAAHERIAIGRIEVLVCASASDVGAWLDWRARGSRDPADPATTRAEAST